MVGLLTRTSLLLQTFRGHELMARGKKIKSVTVYDRKIELRRVMVAVGILRSLRLRV